jgi:hypothetical protein
MYFLTVNYKIYTVDRFYFDLFDRIRSKIAISTRRRRDESIDASLDISSGNLSLFKENQSFFHGNEDTFTL